MLRYIRERFHPLYHLRRVAAFRALATRADFPIRTNIDGISFPVFIKLLQHTALFIGECGVEREERNNFIDICIFNNVNILWDVGANIGLYSFIFKTLSPVGHVVAFEPDPDNIKLLSRTVARNGLDGVSLVPAAVSDACGRARFAPDPVTGHTGALIAAPTTDMAVREVETVTIDSQVRFEPAPDFIKIDVEGGEWAVFRGARETLSRRRPIIFFEASDHIAEIGGFLADLGYRLFDMRTLAEVDQPVHNTLAICPERHRLPLRRNGNRA
jgi:FkbM family methyltransferase